MRASIIGGVASVFLGAVACDRGTGVERLGEPGAPPVQEKLILADPLVTEKSSGDNALELSEKTIDVSRCGRPKVDVVEVQGCDASDVERQLRQWTSIVRVCVGKGSVPPTVDIEFLFGADSEMATKIVVVSRVDSYVAECLQMLRSSALRDPPLPHCAGRISWRLGLCAIKNEWR